MWINFPSETFVIFHQFSAAAPIGIFYHVVDINQLHSSVNERFLWYVDTLSRLSQRTHSLTLDVALKWGNFCVLWGGGKSFSETYQTVTFQWCVRGWFVNYVAKFLGVKSHYNV
jgi:hypothetical protein